MANITYYQLNIDYIIEKYCVNKDKPAMHCNGKCHLNSQLGKFDKTKNPGKSTISESFLPVYFQKAFSYTINFQPLVFKVENWKIPLFHATDFIQDLEHPPDIRI
ncbi:hypothetical protein [Autumnicola musiva]|uniref:Uncharacterized protein n=1 Tax=Autumnicola musiva TaxID=3075589 RepID=A0ABU3D5X0_9FLAO|nr:hypothetical protein [Zunongwangia sp. F117]MDT0676930.1 hypothetical protein [Zunongwangia sp. F117]